MPFCGREREIAAITSALIKDENVILTGKYGIGKTALVKEVAKKYAERWHFLFADFSKPPSKVCHDLLDVLKPKSYSRKRIRSMGYKQSRSLLVDTASKARRRCVIIMDDIVKLTSQRLYLIRYLEWDKHFLFIAIPERFLPEDDLSSLRTCLYPTRIIRLGYLSAKQTERFFRDNAVKHRFQWTESDIHMLTMATKGYPLGMREFVKKEIERQK